VNPASDAKGASKASVRTSRSIRSDDTVHTLDVPENLLQLYVENSPLALIQFDMEWRVIAWSERATAMFGWSEDDVRGKKLDEFNFVVEADWPGVAALFEALAHGPVNWQANDNRNRRRDSSIVHCRWFNAFLRSDSFTGYVSLAEDVTASVLAREAASVSEERLRALFEATPDALMFFDTLGVITDANPASEHLMGRTHAEIIGRSFADFIVPEEVAFAAGMTTRVLSGETVNAELNVKRLAGGTFPVEFVSGPLRERGEISGFFCAARDISGRNEAVARLEASEERFRSIFDNNPDPMIAFDTDATVTRANAAAGRVLEIDPDALIGATLGDIALDGNLAEALACFNRALAGMAGGIELHIRHARDGSLPAFVTMIPIRFRGFSSGVHLHVRDLRATLAHQRQIATHAERIRDLYMSAAAANEDADKQITATIEAGCRILGLSSAAIYESATDRIVESFGEPLGAGLARLALASDRALAIDDVRGLPALQGDPDAASFVTFIGTTIDISGTRYGSLCFADRRRRRTAFDDVDRDLVQLMGALVSSAIERGRSRARLQTLAYNDAVTALPNRAWLVENLRAMLESARTAETPIGVLFLDLDRFKDINDTLGHAAGDRLLRIIGERLTRAIRTSDVVARMGGDEFVVLAGDAPDMQALGGLAERIIATVEEAVDIDGAEYFVTTSIGIASFPADGGDAETLVKHADVAMYRAKDRGRNTYQFFTPALNATLHTRLSQEKTLRKALENGEFAVYYQPQHDLISGKMTAVEALVRWNHPRSGIVLPGQFIPNAELSGLIVALGDFILETACRDISALRKTIAPDLRLAVNLSARQFHQQRLAAKVRACVERTHFDATALELEITESVAMNDAALTVSIMRELGAEGMSLAVDDFGTGYSSLGYLRRFPLDSIKIDRSFVTDLAHEPEDATIVRTVIAMAHALDLEVIAEGVETASQLEFLRAENCDRVQGFYFSQAVSLPALEAYIIQGSKTAAAG
jgi:diguanylate cyclase (GGDEF)-like protein/PAS domain S-box-containing protein